MNGIDVMRRHLAKPGILKLKNEDGTEDEIEIQPLTTESFPEFWTVFEGFATIDPKALKDDKDMDFALFFKAIDKDRAKTIRDLIITSVTRTYPSADKKTIDSFVSKNFFELMMLLIEINLPAAGAVEKKKAKRR